jgi:hypothetical protein
MFHKSRAWKLADVATLGELADKLHGHTWCCCNGFRHNEFLFLNDATCEDGAQEYAIVVLDPADQPTESTMLMGTQIESLTVSWVESREKLLAYFEGWESGTFATVWREPVAVRTHTGTCRHCA